MAERANGGSVTVRAGGAANCDGLNLATVKLRSTTGAAAKRAYSSLGRPECAGPGRRRHTAPPFVTHVPVVIEATATANPDEDVTVTTNGASPNILADSGANVVADEVNRKGW